MGNCFGKRKDYKYVKTEDNEVPEFETMQQSPTTSFPPRLELVMDQENVGAEVRL